MQLLQRFRGNILAVGPECGYGSDIYIKLPALEKLNAMFLEILDSSESREFWYVDEGNQSPSSNISSLFGRLIHRNDEKRWLPIPCVPDYGLHEKSRKELHKKHECTNKIPKAAMAINSSILAEMVVPESDLATLPKSGRTGIGRQYGCWPSNSVFVGGCWASNSGKLLKGVGEFSIQHCFLDK